MASAVNFAECSFEPTLTPSDYCDLKNRQLTNQWLMLKGPTATEGTGPTADHTTGIATGTTHIHHKFNVLKKEWPYAMPNVISYEMTHVMALIMSYGIAYVMSYVMPYVMSYVMPYVVPYAMPYLMSNVMACKRASVLRHYDLLYPVLFMRVSLFKSF